MPGTTPSPGPITTTTKISLIPPDQCGEKIIRWWAVIKQSSLELRFLAGKVNPSDGLSRNPGDREEVLKERARLMSDPRAMEDAFRKEEYADMGPVDEVAEPLLDLYREGATRGDAEDGSADVTGDEEFALAET